MRVITGTARGRKLIAPEGLDVRPTKDSVKEAIFSAIQFETEGSVVLDLFSGSGQLGIEAVSRGAKKAYLVDSSQNSIKFIKQNVAHVGFESQCEIVNMPNSAFLRTTGEKFDIALLDPPYEKDVYKRQQSDFALPYCQPLKNPHRNRRMFSAEPRSHRHLPLRSRSYIHQDPEARRTWLLLWQ